MTEKRMNKVVRMSPQKRQTGQLDHPKMTTLVLSVVIVDQWGYIYTLLVFLYAAIFMSMGAETLSEIIITNTITAALLII